MTALEIDLTHAAWLIELGARGVHAEREKQSTASLPDPDAALSGMKALLAAGQLDAPALRRIVTGAWALLDPHPTQAVPAETWRKLWSMAGPCLDEDEWTRPESLVIYRGCADVNAARSGWHWTVDRGVARCHAEGKVGLNTRTHSDPRIFTTTAPAEALLARLDSYGESKIIVDPELLGEVTEVRRSLWRAEFPKPVQGVLASTGQLVWTTPNRLVWT
jgi:hypothetical protein